MTHLSPRITFKVLEARLKQFRLLDNQVGDLSNDRQDTSTLFREVRAHLNLTQQKLSQKLNISKNYLGYIEQGSTTPSVHLLARLHQLISPTCKT